MNRLLWLALFAALPLVSNAADLLVTSTSNSGAGTLRDQVTLAASGDRIIMAVSGSINLSSPIVISSNLEIIGAFPAHNGINFSSVGSGNYAFDVQSGQLKIRGFRFHNAALTSNVGAIKVATTATIDVDQCVFEQGRGNNGGAIELNGVANISNTCFTGNTSQSDGGAISVSSLSGVATLVNCTFTGNSAGTNGGAMRITSGATSTITHCTFKNNSASLVGQELSVAVLGTTVILQNNIFDNGSAGAFANSGASNFTSLGGNILTFSNPGFISTGINDLFNVGTASLGLSTLITDGFGLRYHKILSGSSPAVDNGTSGTLPSKDCRRAPRIMYGDNALTPDAGAVEYSFYNVTNTNSSGAGSFANAIAQVNASTTPGPYYVDFIYSSVSPILLTASISVSNPVIIDGYTKENSIIPGPGPTVNTLTSLTPTVILDGGSATSIGLQFNATSSGSNISGLNIRNYSNHGIVFSGAGNNRVHGNMIHSNGTHGIELQAGANNNFIGDSAWFRLNMISSNGARGILINGCSGNSIRNNLIGTDQIGTSILGTQPMGIEISGNTSTGNTIGGSALLMHGNLISGNTGAQININASANGNTVAGNKIGTSYDGQSSLASAGSNGVILSSGAFNNTVGGPGSDGRNSICAQGFAGVTIQDAPSNSVVNNYIGYFPNPSPVVMPNNQGIFITGSNSTGNNIGNNGVRNFICGNTQCGVRFVNNASSNSLVANFIGVNHLNTALPNNGPGVLIETSANNNSIGTAGSGNIISSNNGPGISINGSSSTIILNNTIGLDSTRLLARGNVLDGISVNAGNNTQINGNFICFNFDQGIELNSDSVLVINNSIGTDLGGTINQGNGSHGITINGHRNRIGDGNFGINTIAFNSLAGVEVNFGTENGIVKNQIYSNGGLGIDLAPIGVTNNDVGDADTGPNNLINFTDNFVATQCGTATTFAGFFEGTVGNSYRIDFYHLTLTGSDPSGHGECDSWIGSITITPSVSGSTYFSYFHTASFPLGTIVTATVSKIIGAGGFFETSEFSINTAVESGINGSTVSSANITCFGAADGTATLTPNGGLPTYGYEWFTSGNTSITGQTSDVISVLGPGTYYGLVTDFTGCRDTTASFTITEPLPLTATPTFTSPVCNGDCNGTITINATGGTGTIEFSNDNGSTYQASDTFTGLCAGVYGSLVIRDQNNCTLNVASVTIPDPPLFTASVASSNNETCPGSCDGSIALNTSGGVTPYSFSTDGGTNFTTSNPITNLCAGTYSVVIQDANGCATSPTSVTLTTSTLLQSDAGPDITSCAGVPVTLDGSSSVNASTYAWTVSGNATNIGNNSTVSVSPTATTTYVLTISGGGCTSHDTVLVTIIPTPDPNIVYALASNDTLLICSNGTTLNPTITTPGGTFSSSAGISIDAVTGVANFSTALLGIEYIYYTTSSCNQKDTVVALILPPPSVPTSAQYDFTICQGDPVPTFNVNTSGVFGLLVWYGTSALTNPIGVGSTYTPPNLPASFNDYFVAQLYSNCSSTATPFTVSVIDNSVITTGGPYQVCEGQSVQLNLNVTSGTLSSISWTPGSTLSDSTVLNPFSSPSQTTTYSYNALIGSCQVSGFVTVQLSTDPNCIFEETYNAFSPDGDGVNETWIIPGATLHPNNTVILFNRWGDAFREYTNYDNISVVWDGTNGSGQVMPSGTYFYVIRYHDIDRQFSGWVQITR